MASFKPRNHRLGTSRYLADLSQVKTGEVNADFPTNDSGHEIWWDVLTVGEVTPTKFGGLGAQAGRLPSEFMVYGFQASSFCREVCWDVD